MYRNVLQDDQHADNSAAGEIRAQSIRVEERWESLGADGRPYCSEATREDLIYRHLQSNAGLSTARAEILAMGGHSEIIGEPLTRIRKVTRYETTAVWEVAADIEAVDELTEIANMPQCDHPAVRIYTANLGHRYCGRCGERMTDA